MILIMIMMMNMKTRTMKITTIGHFAKYHNTICLSFQILHKHCYHFLLAVAIFPREIENSAYANVKSIKVFFKVGYTDDFHFVAKRGQVVQQNPA